MVFEYAEIDGWRTALTTLWSFFFLFQVVMKIGEITSLRERHALSRKVKQVQYQASPTHYCFGPQQI